MHDNYHLHRYPCSSASRRSRSLADHGDRLRRRHGLIGQRRHQGEAEGSARARAQGRRRHPCPSHRHPVVGPHARSGVADLGLSQTLEAVRPMVVSDDRSIEQLRQQLVDRVGSLGWVVEGVVHSIAMSDIDSAMRLWGDEAIDLLWERQMLVSPDGNPNHRGVRLSDDAMAWASAQRAQRLLAPTPSLHNPLPIEHLALSTRQAEHREERRKLGPVLAGHHR